jgi:uncharacterized membrane protein
MLLIKFFIVITLFFIIGSLFMAWKSLTKAEEGSEKVVKALTVRVSLSILLFATLMLLLRFGFIQH